MKKAIYKFIFCTLAGWRIIGAPKEGLKKYIIVVAPHTSNWDFLLGVFTRGVVGFKSRYLAKKQLFLPPLGWLFRLLGGYPVDRSKSSNMVEAVAEIFNQHSEFVIAITPEGTRKQVTKWKSGFYHIATLAKIPLVFAGLDYATKSVIFRDEPYWPSGDYQKDLPEIQGWFADKKGLNEA
ncbi:MAG TPA: acyltransferase [Cytophagales bacterium]|jgi:1-acyl-sn-glycerol-3-phosphate acyltransferase|nr:acyltransferase [Cytophagales bacterium]